MTLSPNKERTAMTRAATRLAGMIVAALLLGACQAAPTPGTEIPTNSPSPVPTGTLAPSSRPTSDDSTAIVVPETDAADLSDTPTPPLLPVPARINYHPAELTPLPDSGSMIIDGILPTGAVRRFGIGNFTDVALTADGRYLVIGGSIGILVYETSKMELLWHGLSTVLVTVVGWSPDGTMIATGRQDGSIVVWDAAAATPIVISDQHDHSVDTISWAPDSSRFVSTAADEPAIVWDLPHGSLSRMVAAGWPATIDRTHTSCSFSADGTMIACDYDIGRGDVGNFTTEVTLWDSHTYELICVIDTGEYIISLQWSSTGDMFALVTTSSISIWDAETGEKSLQIIEISDAGSVAPYVQWSPDGRQVALLSDSTLSIIDVTNSAVVKTFTPSRYYASGYSWSNDGTRMVLWQYQKVHILNANTYREISSFEMSDTGLEVSANAHIVATLSGHWPLRRVSVWNTTTGDLLGQVDGTLDVVDVAWSPDSEQIASGHTLDTVYLWSFEDGRAIGMAQGSRFVPLLTWLPDGQLGVSSYGPSTSMPKPELPDVEVDEPIGTPVRFEMSPDGSQYAICTEERIITEYNETTSQSEIVDSIPGMVIIVDAATDQSLDLLPGDGPDLTDVTWSPDGRYVASGYGVNPYLDWPLERYVYDGGPPSSVLIWDVETGERVREFKGHTGNVYTVEWSPDGKYLASGSADGTVILWDVSDLP